MRPKSFQSEVVYGVGTRHSENTLAIIFKGALPHLNQVGLLGKISFMHNCPIASVVSGIGPIKVIKYMASSDQTPKWGINE